METSAYFECVSRTAASIVSTTTLGAVYIGVWSTACDWIVAPIRLAMKSCVSGTIIRSSLAMRYHVGVFFHAGAGTFSWIHCTDIGLRTVCMMASWSGEALWATAR